MPMDRHYLLQEVKHVCKSVLPWQCFESNDTRFFCGNLAAFSLIASLRGLLLSGQGSQTICHGFILLNRFIINYYTIVHVVLLCCQNVYDTLVCAYCIQQNKIMTMWKHNTEFLFNLGTLLLQFFVLDKTLKESVLSNIKNWHQNRLTYCP